MTDVLCLGGTGTVGTLVVEGVIARGQSVRCMTRSREMAGTTEGALSYVYGDLEDRASLGPAFEGAARVHLLTPLHPEETRLGTNAVEAARAAGAERIVLHSVHRVDEAPHIPHFRSKIEILEAIVRSGIGWTSIEPNHYFQNDLLLGDALQAGVYPAPVGPIGLSRVDTRDIADATIHALLDDGHEGLRVPLVGPFSLTGEDVARIWSDQLGHPVTYTGDDLDAWADAMAPLLPAWMLDDLRTMCEHFLEHGLRASEEDFASLSHVLGHAPRTFDDFVAETAASWPTP